MESDSVRKAVEIAKDIKESPVSLNTEQLAFLFSAIDLTTLNNHDNDESVKAFCEKVNDFDAPKYNLPYLAAVCVFPNFIATAKKTLVNSAIQLACVTGNFPTGQTFPLMKVIETQKAVEDGASEIDMVINRGYTVNNEFSLIEKEVSEVKSACDGARLKVILETSDFSDDMKLYSASMAALKGGADFLKTSTGKTSEGATLHKGAILCAAIKDHATKWGMQTGVKFSGGIRTSEDAQRYVRLVHEILGKDWITPTFFRIGASSLAGKVLTDMDKNISHSF
ncbi:MAG: deoxyribose-phosphate aldolase [Salibacter sp.]|uniref:deoxyribose-phosphate aldolase n=1 Tax=Salibacter sp. TaxID=2010995 RepID=UPI002870B2D2|nr:deoxyribose-phosphate aldolase [Salibacter sp.]MDR9398001.1 deoxyribose-phosphate aldolase [Salibacter sp.]